MIRFGILLSAGIAVLSASSGAAPNEAIAFAIGQCSAEPDAKARLACYDGLAAQLKTGIPLAPTAAPAMTQAPAAPAPVAQAPVAPPAQVAAVPPPATQGGTWYNPTSWFGKDTPQRSSNNPADFGAEAVKNQQAAAGSAEPQPLEEIRSDIVSFAYAPNGKFIVTLANGQVWRQIDADSGTVRLSNGKHYVATISRGALGSYNFTLDDGDMLHKVKRLK